jgi:asparagine synthase (glutamine-hydrolysing)
MPGIAGIISHRSPDECQHLVNKMIGSMKYEPFYASGTCFVQEMGVYGGWVAHEGSFAAHQSAHRDRNNVTLLFSGECFPNFVECVSSSTEGIKGADGCLNGLLNLYCEHGHRFVEKLNGLFSGLLIDCKRKRALLFNDRYGIERIYYYEKGDLIAFASEAKALLRILPELRAFDDEGVAQFLSFGCTFEGKTLFRKLRFLPGGSLWVFEENLCSRKGQYFCPENWESQPDLTEEAFELEFIETFRRILPRYASSNSKIGISLTGGLDTRMIMACLPKYENKPVCYTFSGLTEKTLDVRLASQVARICGIEHHILRIGMDFFSNFGQYVDRTVFITDGCAGALVAHEIYFNAMARQFSEIRLTGNFGSEILRNMSTFKPLRLNNKLFNVEFSQRVDSVMQSVLDNGQHPVTFAAFREIPWNLFGILAAGKSQLTFRTPYLDNDIVALAFQAPQNSRLSSQPAMRLVNESNPKLARIPTDRGVVLGGGGFIFLTRRLLSEVLFRLDYIHKEGLPHWLSHFDPLIDPLIGSLSAFGLLGLHKFLPYRGWFRKELSSYSSEALSDLHTQQQPYWNSRFLDSVIRDHVQGRKNYIHEIHAILTLEAVERLLIRGFSR